MAVVITRDHIYRRKNGLNLKFSKAASLGFFKDNFCDVRIITTFYWNLDEYTFFLRTGGIKERLNMNLFEVFGLAGKPDRSVR